MIDSDSESESECFESAEESLDEEEIEKKTRSKKNSRESESEVSEPVVSPNAEVNETSLARDVSNNLQSYRKRRERVKHTSSIPSSKVIHKNQKCHETVFRTDVADVFFQDITNNLSKNINRSLHTLQQTSSNVKDLILSSLPASSVCEKEEFVYDDGLDTLPPPVDNKVLSNDIFDDKTDVKKCYSNELPECLSVKINEGKDNPIIESNENKVSVPSEKKYLELNSENYLIDKKIVQTSDSENCHFNSSEINQQITEPNKSKPSKSINIEDDNHLATATNKIKRILDHSNKCYSTDQVLQTSKLNDDKNFNIQRDEINPCESSVNISLQVNHEVETQKLKNDEHVDSGFCESIVPSSIATKNCGTDTSSEILNYSKSLAIQEYYSDSTNKEGDLKIDCKNLPMQGKKNVKEDNLGTELDLKEGKIPQMNEKFFNKKVDVDNVQDEISENDVIMNVDGLERHKDIKTKQEEIIDKYENSEGGALKSEFNVKESNDKSHIKFDDGWDDFDFSDNEIENNNTEEVNKNAESNISKATEEDMKVKKQILTETSEVSEIKFNTNCAMENMTKTMSSSEGGNEEKIIHEKKQTSEKESFDESWNWESWDDEINNTKEENKIDDKTETKNCDKAKRTSDDVGQWSGWDTLCQTVEEKQGNWNIGTWGVNLLLNKATAVTQGISNVLEAGLGAPDPETLARMQNEEERELKQKIVKTENYEQPEESPKKNSLTGVNLFPVSGITNLVAGVTSKLVEHTKIQEIGSRVLTGGLDTLETFGKKTMEVLQDGDPGLRNKRALLLGNNKPVLSQILREAREKADKEIKQTEEQALAKNCHFEILFDDFQGMVHLEALEMLSRQYELKLEQFKSGMSLEELEDLEGVLDEVEQLCALDDIDLNSSVLDFKTSLQIALEPLKEEISVEKIIQIQDKVNKWLQTSSELDPSIITLHQKAVSTVAELTAATVHQFLKAGELLSIKECRKTVDEIDALAKFTNILCMEINKACEKFILMAEKKKDLDSSNTVAQKITIVRNNSNSYIKQAFNLLIPILQAGAAL